MGKHVVASGQARDALQGTLKTKEAEFNKQAMG
jgi:hypothetical protein